jgi:hypothetical protein
MDVCISGQFNSTLETLLHINNVWSLFKFLLCHNRTEENYIVNDNFPAVLFKIFLSFVWLAFNHNLYQ